MYTYILAVFLQTTPIPNVLFVERYTSKETCLAAETYFTRTYPEVPKDNVLCMAVLLSKIEGA